VELDSVAVKFDFVDPVRSRWRAIAQNGLASLDETETRHASEYTIELKGPRLALLIRTRP